MLGFDLELGPIALRDVFDPHVLAGAGDVGQVAGAVVREKRFLHRHPVSGPKAAKALLGGLDLDEPNVSAWVDGDQVPRPSYVPAGADEEVQAFEILGDEQLRRVAFAGRVDG